ncbi:signal peptide peptidase-domain-containing protein [Pilobolus umbonatus]|nr:signal peptide peptidase-domain-containing protein [Pilobolus umbonatus]
MDTETSNIGLYIAYGAILTMAVVPIYAGASGSINSMKRPKNAPKPKASDSPLDDSDDEDESIVESLTSNDAYMFPVIGSCVLFSMYLVYRYLNKDYINYILTSYFSIMGCGAVAKTLLLVTKAITPVSCLKNVAKYKLTLSKRGKNVSHLNFSFIHGFLLLTSIVLTVYYGYTKNWIASNVFGLSFSINAIQLLSLDSFKTGIILLSGLFIYDIFWVFYTPVMVSVAKNFDAPIKLLWPRDIISYVMQSADKVPFTMLGLGDIVIPGIFVALCLRYDRHMSWKQKPVGEFRSLQFPKPYFTSCMIAYVIGLATTMAVMHFFKAAQPALLYLSPACILSVVLTAAVRGELKEVFDYKIEEEKDEKEKKKRVKEIERVTIEERKVEVEEIEIDDDGEKEDSTQDEEIVLEEEEDTMVEENKFNSKKNASKKKKNKK